jgi:hypothetical protein
VPLVLNDGTHLGRGKNTISLHGCGVEKPQSNTKKKVCTVLLPPVVNPITIDKYIIFYHGTLKAFSLLSFFVLLVAITSCLLFNALWLFHLHLILSIFMGIF